MSRKWRDWWHAVSKIEFTMKPSLPFNAKSRTPDWLGCRSMQLIVPRRLNFVRKLVCRRKLALILVTRVVHIKHGVKVICIVTRSDNRRNQNSRTRGTILKIHFQIWNVHSARLTVYSDFLVVMCLCSPCLPFHSLPRFDYSSSGISLCFLVKSFRRTVIQLLNLDGTSRVHDGPL